MSFLTPLYLLGALAVTLPVVFHMIRRTPRGRREFSSVMFLEASPPRITRRSRIEHWLLLLLRAAAVCLLAIAFSRPFFRLQDDQAVAAGDSREVVVLLDTSASMRREGLWPEAVERVHQLVGETEPRDRVALLTFDNQLRVIMDFEEWASLDSSQQAEAVLTLMADLSPTWGATDLGRALIEAAEHLDSGKDDEGVTHSQTIIVVSDLQEGSRLELLQAYRWPQRARVRLEQVGSDVSPDNAGLHPVQRASDSSSASHVRVRVTNAANARHERFTLRWADEFSEPADSKGGSVIVPPGKSRLVTVPERQETPGPTHLILDGDQHPFDNTCFVGAAPQRNVNVVLITDDAADDPQGMRYYLERAFLVTPDRVVHVDADVESIAEKLKEQTVDLVVVMTRPSAEMIESLAAFVTDGGNVFVVPPDAATIRVVYELLSITPVETTEAAVDNYHMLTEIDFTHPLFAALGHPRFSDFTKVRFWRHRQVEVESLPNVRVLARFDDGDMAAGEVSLGLGHIVFLTSGWQPDDSQLALSTKFVPMLNSLLDEAAGIVRRRSQHLVGDTVDLSEFVLPNEDVVGVITPAGDEVAIDGESRLFATTDQPGRYRVILSDRQDVPRPEFVVNLDPSESQTSPLPIESLRAAGIPMGDGAQTQASSTEVKRQRLNSELENQQKLWRWIIIAVIVLLLAETWLASRTARGQLATARDR